MTTREQREQLSSRFRTIANPFDRQMVRELYRSILDDLDAAEKRVEQAVELLRAVITEPDSVAEAFTHANAIGDAQDFLADFDGKTREETTCSRQ